jgi:hypothetical protein
LTAAGGTAAVERWRTLPGSIRAPALAALLLAATVALAQPTGDDQAAEAAASDEQDAATVDSTRAGASPYESPVRADRSPTDYRASEEISEDLSVSFPVDI